MGQDHDDIPAGRLLSLDPRPAAVARGRERLRHDPVPAEALADAMLEAHDLLRSAAGERCRPTRESSAPMVGPPTPPPVSRWPADMLAAP